mmetsp:Transcript_22149/g.37684  ORF Transcript_22149/g.37684 Transcript_22149/m.37684 type:complete len:92 (-) Transcript_22149:66-341(-)
MNKQSMTWGVFWSIAVVLARHSIRFANIYTPDGMGRSLAMDGSLVMDSVTISFQQLQAGNRVGYQSCGWAREGHFWDDDFAYVAAEQFDGG